jgi:SHS2 domain-containing protein
MSTSKYTEIEHTADNALHIQAENMGELLKHAALGMFNLLGLPSDGEGVSKRRIELKGLDREDLLVVWLEELLYLIEMHEVGFGDVDIEVQQDKNLVAMIDEIPGMVPRKEIKAVTYHGLEIIETKRGLEVTVTFDV